MMLGRAVAIALAAFTTISGTRTALAQPLTVTENGRPLAGAQVSAMINGIKTPLGTTNAGGKVTLDTSGLAITRGSEVTVWIKTCEDGEVQVILVPAGEQGECVEEGAQAGERCGCRRAGVILWGGGPVTIDVGTGTVTPTGTGGAARPREDHAFADLQIGVTVDYSTFYNWEDVGCGQDGIGSCEADGGAPGIGAYLDYRFGTSPFGLSLEAHYAKLDIEQTFQSGDGLPTSSEGDVDSWSFQAAAVYSYGFSPRLAWYGRSGYALLYNDARFTSLFPTGPVSEDRTNTASQFLIGTGFHFPIAENWCARTGVDLTTAFDSENGDENARLSFAIGYRYDLNRM
jgi:opacity protein-like surface antigen